MPYPFSYAHEADLGLWDPERLLDAAADAARADGMTARERARGRLVVECPLERLFQETTTPTIVPTVIELTVAGDGAQRRLRARATFGVVQALVGAFAAAPMVAAAAMSPSRSPRALLEGAALVAFAWLLTYLFGMLGARGWVRRRLEGPVVR